MGERAVIAVERWSAGQARRGHVGEARKKRSVRRSYPRRRGSLPLTPRLCPFLGALCVRSMGRRPASRVSGRGRAVEVRPNSCAIGARSWLCSRAFTLARASAPTESLVLAGRAWAQRRRISCRDSAQLAAPPQLSSDVCSCRPDSGKALWIRIRIRNRTLPLVPVAPLPRRGPCRTGSVRPCCTGRSDAARRYRTSAPRRWDTARGFRASGARRQLTTLTHLSPCAWHVHRRHGLGPDPASTWQVCTPAARTASAAPHAWRVSTLSSSSAPPGREASGAGELGGEEGFGRWAPGAHQRAASRASATAANAASANEVEGRCGTGSARGAAPLDARCPPNRNPSSSEATSSVMGMACSQGNPAGWVR